VSQDPSKAPLATAFDRHYRMEIYGYPSRRYHQINYN
jgi:hypothetical protein